ncbi:hypothetical protein KFU94_67010 [Chloroflexi bacterium TSY]|uniref:Uncharacterized protein n=1 Tax=Entotheonella factor TaxID=1429438 RepID=W4LF39_ENTF1|nr:MAG: hypothetical protein ETSY1_25530 [Candidatus Entotheonella factor]MBV7339489.1 hypothetical protein [Chloroflexi bacterium TSY]WAB21621.1 hypothetical protein [Chloroflexota bacterium]
MPRGLVVVTAERGALGKSTNARLFTVPVEPLDIDVDKLTQAQDNRELYGYAMRGFIQHVAGLWDRCVKELPKDVKKLRAANSKDKLHAKDKLHGKLSDAVAKLGCGFNLFLSYAHHVGVLSHEEVGKMTQDARNALRCLARDQQDHVSASDPALQFMQTLVALLRQEKVQIQAKGVAVKSLGGPIGEQGQTDAERIGWHDDNDLHLLQTAYNVVTRYFRAEGREFPIDELTLRRELERGGYAVSSKTSRKRDPHEKGKQKRVFTLLSEPFWRVAGEMGITKQDIGASKCDRG